MASRHALHVKWIKKRVKGDDVTAMHSLAVFYVRGGADLPQDYDEAKKLFLRAGELGGTTSYYNVAKAYYRGESVDVDMKKAKHYWELASMGGNVVARHNLGSLEGRTGNMNRAVKHFMIAAGAGWDASLTVIRECFMNGYVNKDDFEKALRAHKESKDEMNSDQRATAAAFLGQNGLLPPDLALEQFYGQN